MDRIARRAGGIAAAVVIAAVAGLAACARVHPYERETLAHPAMQEPAWELLDRADTHMFEVREASGGAIGTAGGGCGCN